MMHQVQPVLGLLALRRKRSANYIFRRPGRPFVYITSARDCARSDSTGYRPSTANADIAFWYHLQHELFPFLRDGDHLALSPALEKVIWVLEFTQVDRFIPSSGGFVGRPPKNRVALARAFVAKADQVLRRLCGFERFHAIAGASASRASLRNSPPWSYRRGSTRR